MDEPVQAGSEQGAEPTGQPQGDVPRHTLYWLWWPPVFLLVYILCVGPAEKLYRAFPATQPALGVIYQPLRELGARCPPFAKAMTWYLEDVWQLR